jgi:hypothetical protein
MPSMPMNRNQLQTASSLNVVAGVWMFISAFVIYAHGPMVTNNVVFGMLVTVFALCRISGAYDQSWLSWLNAVVGIWVIVSPWATMGTGATGPTQAMIINNCVTGGAVLLLACWSAIATDAEPTRTLDSGMSRTPFAR